VAWPSGENDRFIKGDWAMRPMKIARASIVLAVWVMIPAFSAEDPQEISERQALIDRFVYDAPLFIRGKSLPALRKLGPLKKERIDRRPNPHDPGKMLEYRTLTFKGLTVRGFVNDQNELAIIQISVTDSRWKILHGLNVGSPAAGIGKVLGKATREEKNTREYCGETECVDFNVKKGRIAEVVFNYYSD
jgi:hypothetical protein